MENVIILGLDGATWDIIDPLIARGEMPNFQLLKEGGAWGEVNTTYLGSPVIWTAIFTGKDRDKFGDPFFGIDRARLRAKRIWEIAAQRGLRIGVLHSLLTWPPLEIDGFVIPDIFAMGPETYPSSYQVFQKLYLSRHGGNILQQGYYFWRSFLFCGSLDVTLSALRFLLSSSLRPGLLNTFRRRLEVVTGMDFNLFLRLYDQFRPRLSTFHLHALDTVSHKYWQYKGKTGPYGAVIEDFYRLADRFLGRVMNILDQQTSLIVVADHGFEEIKDERSKFELNVPTLRNLLKVDSGVRAVRIGNAFVMNLGTSVEEGEALRLADELSGATLQDGSSLFINVNKIDRNIHFRLTKHILESRTPAEERISFPKSGQMLFGELFRQKTFVDTGTHAAGRGIFAVYGQKFRSNVPLGKIQIFNIAPTVLALLGLPMARDMDGDLDQRWFTPEALAALQPQYIASYETTGGTGEASSPQTSFTEQEVEDLEARLKMLGYL